MGIEVLNLEIWALMSLQMLFCCKCYFAYSRENVSTLSVNLLCDVSILVIPAAIFSGFLTKAWFRNNFFFSSRLLFLFLENNACLKEFFEDTLISFFSSLMLRYASAKCLEAYLKQEVK